MDTVRLLLTTDILRHRLREAVLEDHTLLYLAWHILGIRRHTER